MRCAARRQSAVLTWTPRSVLSCRPTPLPTHYTRLAAQHGLNSLACASCPLVRSSRSSARPSVQPQRPHRPHRPPKPRLPHRLPHRPHRTPTKHRESTQPCARPTRPWISVCPTLPGIGYRVKKLMTPGRSDDQKGGGNQGGGNQSDNQGDKQDKGNNGKGNKNAQWVRVAYVHPSSLTDG